MSPVFPQFSILWLNLGPNEQNVEMTYVSKASFAVKALFLFPRICTDMHPCFGFQNLYIRGRPTPFQFGWCCIPSPVLFVCSPVRLCFCDVLFLPFPELRAVTHCMCRLGRRQQCEVSTWSKERGRPSLVSSCAGINFVSGGLAGVSEFCSFLGCSGWGQAVEAESVCSGGVL